MAFRLEGDNQLNEIIFQSPIDSFPHRDNYEKITQAVGSHALSIEALESGGSPPASSSAEVIAARDEAADLQTRIRTSDRRVFDGVSSGVLNECEVQASATPDDKVVVDTGQGIVNGALFRETSTQTLDPADFAGGVVNPRIDVVYISADGTAGVTTGLPAVAPQPEQIPDNTIELARLFLYPSGGTPNAPKPIKDFQDNATNSFIIKKLDHFLYKPGRTRRDRRLINLVRNGSFEILDDLGAIWSWSGTNATIAQSAVTSVFGDISMKITNDGTNSQHYAATTMPSPLTVRNKFVTVTAYIALAQLPTASAIQSTVELVQTGASPATSDKVNVTINAQRFQRVVLQAYIDNDTTAIEIRIYPDGDATQVSTTAIYVDGVQVTQGLDVVGFQYPVPVVYEPDGSVKVMDLEIFNDITVGNDFNVDNDLTVGNDLQVDRNANVAGRLTAGRFDDIRAWWGYARRR